MTMTYAPVLVTGVAGYIGAQVARTLRDAGRRIIGIDNLSTGSRGSVPLDIEFYEEDFGDEPRILEIMRQFGVEEVMHLGGLVDVEESMWEPKKYIRVNTYNTRKLIRASIAAGVKRFVFSSTAAVYGSPPQNPVDERCETLPVNPYGHSKLKAEKIIKAYAKRSGLQYAILRFFNVAGVDPDERGGYPIGNPTHLIRRAVQAALGMRDHLEIYGTDYPTSDGSAVRDYIHVDDIAKAHLVVLRHLQEERGSDTYNVGLNRGYSVFEVKTEVERMSKKRIHLRFSGRRPGDPAAIVAKADKIRALGWNPRFDLSDMVGHELRWVAPHSPEFALEE
jgi:UDP-glucose 4-epimerase